MSCPKGNITGTGGKIAMSEKEFTQGELSLKQQAEVMNIYHGTADTYYVVEGGAVRAKRKLPDGSIQDQGEANMTHAPVLKTGSYYEYYRSENQYKKVDISTNKTSSGMLDIKIETTIVNKANNLEEKSQRSILVLKNDYKEIKKGIYAFTQKAKMRSREEGQSFKLSNFK